ncbi:MAG TPA: acetyl-CoA hydrolase/transferase C-terminal domain-containing protein [Actinospica sp.]|jgi:acyl-CoA hydrolase|nr:acetyl-CoA hydrolase/transferase C-terminal domain-containing protein [Actinospica sp.]
MRIIDGAQIAAHLPLAEAGTPRIVASGNHATPWRLLEAVDKAVPAYRLFMLAAQHGVPVRDGVRHESPFVGPGMRGLPTLDYLPTRLSLVPRILASTRRPDMVLLNVAPPRDGMLSLGVEVNVLPAAIEQCRANGGLVLAQINPLMPYTYGDAQIPLDAVDLAIEAEEPLALPAPRAAALDGQMRRIGHSVAGMIGDGATLQAGIGAVPDSVLAELGRRRGLRIWSEMISDGVLGLERSGALDQDTDLTASFLFGSAELYAWVDRNPRLRMLRTETVNDPARICAQPAMTSINTALQVDLFAEANASYVRGGVYSGFGGQTDFVVGALHSPGGQAIIALPSWHAKSDTSTVVGRLTEPVTSFQHTAIVTEIGRADLFGLTRQEQAANLIEHAARPEAREQLRAEASRLGL